MVLGMRAAPHAGQLALGGRAGWLAGVLVGGCVGDWLSWKGKTGIGRRSNKPLATPPTHRHCISAGSPRLWRDSIGRCMGAGQRGTAVAAARRLPPQQRAPGRRPCPTGWPAPGCRGDANGGALHNATCCTSCAVAAALQPPPTPTPHTCHAVALARAPPQPCALARSWH